MVLKPVHGVSYHTYKSMDKNKPSKDECWVLGPNLHVKVKRIPRAVAVAVAVAVAAGAGGAAVAAVSSLSLRMKKRMGRSWRRS
ncbi:hypothetical protein M0802_001878 [Mischocyttarus mexicanus]|nr:hypothetical protein M0802_001878 [Mischocyttarus mexicanus]